MTLLRKIADSPHALFVVVVLAVLFGLGSYANMPFELQPTVDKPEINISVTYPGAAPAEVEEAIVRPIEEELQEVSGVTDITSTSNESFAQISLEFDWNTNVDERLVDVINRLGNVRDLPEESDSPVVEVASSANEERIMWIIARPKDGVEDWTSLRIRHQIEAWVEPRLSRVKGVGSVFVVGGSEREIHVDVDLEGLARRNLTIADIAQILRMENRNVRGGPLDIGKRRFRVRTTGRAETMEDLGNLVLQRTATGVTLLKDVAKVVDASRLQDAVLRHSGVEAVAMGVARRVGANVPEVSLRLEEEISRINKDLSQQKMGFELRKVYTDMTYIDASLEMVKSNLLQGAALTIIVLLVFLKSPRPVLVIALSIPLSVVTSFMLLNALGRTLNVISLAGISFAVGMTVDNAVVVLEMIFKRLEQGVPLREAAVEGAETVVVSLIGGTLTTVAVFFPVLLIDGEVGQLMKDLALAILCSVAVSLVTSVGVIPALSRGLMKGIKPPPPDAPFPHKSRFGKLIYAMVKPGGKGIALKIAVIGIAAGLSWLGWMVKPALNYLPEGNRNLILMLFGAMPGTNYKHLTDLTLPVEQALLKDKRVDMFFNVLAPGRFTAIGMTVKPEYADAGSLNKFLGDVRNLGFQQTGWQYVFPIKASIFRTPSREFQIHLKGPNLDRMMGSMFGLMGQMSQDPNLISVRPGFQPGAPELAVQLDRPRLRELGMNADDVASVVEAALGGRFASRFVEGNKEFNVVVRAGGGGISSAEDLEGLKIYARGGSMIGLGDVARVVETRAPVAINHRDLERSVSLTVNLNEEARMTDVLAEVETKYLEPMREQLGTGYDIRVGGTADRLNETLQQLIGSLDPLKVGSLPIAIFIVYLIMVALFRSFKYPLVVMITVPLAMTGAFFGVSLADWNMHRVMGVGIGFDMITMFGLIILVGIVVNSAILLVDRTLQWREMGLDIYESIAASAADRLRPIAMTSITTVFGMLPLALGQGAGAEMYQGLGAALVGGLGLSTLLTPLVVPALMGVVDGFGTKHQAVHSPVAEKLFEGPEPEPSLGGVS